MELYNYGYVTEYEWTLEDVLGIDLRPCDENLLKTTLAQITDVVLPDDSISFLAKYVMTRYTNWYCVVTNIPTLDRKVIVDFGYKLVNTTLFTQDKYLQLISYYTILKDKLMDQIKASSSQSNRFNDTPQNGGMFADDNHTTNITQIEATSSQDLKTPAERLKEIQETLRNIYLEWSNEYAILFYRE